MNGNPLNVAMVDHLGADDDGFIKVTKKKLGGNNRGTKNFKLISMKPKTMYRPKVNQSTTEVNPKAAPSASKKNISSSGNSSKATSKETVSTSGIGTFSISNSFEAFYIDNSVTKEVDLGNRASTFGVQEEGQSFTLVVDKINMIEQQLNGKCLLVDNDGKPLANIDYLGDHDSDDEVETC
ncbi:hypothetical protein Tco_0147236 [Tanacetum coccineum]